MRKKQTREQAIAWVLYFTEGYVANIEQHMRKHIRVLDDQTIAVFQRGQQQARETAMKLRQKLRKKT